MPAPPPPGQGGGHGHGHKKPQNIANERPADADYWNVRELYLRRQMATMRPAPAPEEADDDAQAIAELPYGVVKKYNDERSLLTVAMRNAPDIAAMKKYGAELTQLNAEFRVKINNTATKRLNAAKPEI